MKAFDPILALMAVVSVAQRLPLNITLNSLTSSQGFQLGTPSDISGSGSQFSNSMNAAGDINGDNIPDFAIAACTSNVGSFSSAGVVFVVFGSQSVFSSPSFVFLPHSRSLSNLFSTFELFFKLLLASFLI